MRRRSGIAVDPVPLMIHLIGEHGAQDGMAEMVVALVARKVGEQVLDGVIDVFLCGDTLVIAVLWRLPVLFRALLGGLRRGEHGVGRQHVEGVGRGGLFAAHGVGLDGYVGLYAQDYVHSASSNL